MRVLQEIARIFRKDPKKDPDIEEKKIDALQVWSTLDALQLRADFRGTEFRKIEKSKLPEGLIEWVHYDDIGENFRVDISRVIDEVTLRVTSGGHHFKVTTRGQEDIDPTITEGRVEFNNEVLARLKEPPLKFAYHLSRFVFYHWRQANP